MKNEFLRVRGFITRVNKDISAGTWFHYKGYLRYFCGYLVLLQGLKNEFLRVPGLLQGLIKIFLRVPGFITRFDEDISPST